MKFLPALTAALLSSTAAVAQMTGWIDAGAAPYNVVCDNVTDNFAGLSAALVAAHGKRLNLPPGRCGTLQPITIGVPYANNPAHIQAYGTMIVALAPSSQPTITFDRTVVNMVVEGLTVNANYQHDWAVKIVKMTQDGMRDIIAQNGAKGGIWISGSASTPVHHNTWINILSQQNKGPGWYVSGNGGDAGYWVFANICLNCKSMFNTGPASDGFVFDYVSGEWHIEADTNGADVQWGPIIYPVAAARADHTLDLTIIDFSSVTNGTPDTSFAGTANTKGVKWNGGRVQGILSGPWQSLPSATVFANDGAGNKICILSGAPC